MKYFLWFLFFGVLILLGTGYFIKDSGDFSTGNTIIGIGVSIIAFVLMPLFIYHRYKNKDLSQFKFNDKLTKKDD
ncbi:hypothetical protein [Lutibacter sp.]